ncbi:MAG: hypothetical protein ACW9XA_07755 [Candidatus Nitrosopumilus sp. bin_6a]
MMPSEILQILPSHWRQYWYRLDAEIVNQFIEGKIDSNLQPITYDEPESPDTPLSRISRESEREQDVFKINQAKKDKIRAIVLGELREDEE